MLNKLLKHEFKATARLLIPLYLILLAFTIMDRIVLNLNIFKGVLSIIPGLITFGYVISIIAVIMVTFILMIMRFYKNLMTDEGYLMFTLPVKSHQLINSKLLVSIMWTVASVLAVIASIFVVAAAPEDIREITQGLKYFWEELNKEFGGKVLLLIIEFIIIVILVLINSMLMIYVSIAVGQLFNGHKLIGAFAAYIGITTVLQIVMSIFIFIASPIFEETLTTFSSIPNLVFPITIFILIGLNVAFYWVTDYIFKKKLNLE